MKIRCLLGLALFNTLGIFFLIVVLVVTALAH
jgi:hypothetical protein